MAIKKLSLAVILNFLFLYSGAQNLNDKLFSTLLPLNQIFLNYKEFDNSNYQKQSQLLKPIEGAQTNHFLSENSFVDNPGVANFHLTTDLNSQTNSYPTNINGNYFNLKYAVLNNVSYFQANDGIHGSELWRSDGTSKGTYMVKDINPNDSLVYYIIANITTANDKIFFSAYTKESGTELWVSDGTSEGTFMLKNIYSDESGLISGNPHFFHVVNNTVYFVAQGKNYTNSELWKTDGTIAGTILVSDLYTFDRNFSTSINRVASFNNLLFFTVFSSVNGRELWRSNGTDTGTYMVKDISPTNQQYDYEGPSALTEYNNQLYFLANDSSGRKLWVTDGTSRGTSIAKGARDISFSYDDFLYSINIPFPVIDSSIYVRAMTTSTGRELFTYNIYNGKGFSLVSDITSGQAGTYFNVENFLSVNNTLFFSTLNEDGTHSLWSSKGKQNNTVLVKKFEVGKMPYDFTNGFGTLYFGNFDSNFGTELWKSDGTENGTLMVSDINVGSYSSNIYFLTPCNNQVFFSAESLTKGVELWSSDGSSTGTKIIKDINQSASASSIIEYDNFQSLVYGNGIVYNAFTPKYGSELYSSDGTKSGTNLFADMVIGGNGMTIRNLVEKNNNFYFSNQNSYTGHTFICKTDRIKLDTLSDIANNSQLINFAVADNNLLFYEIANGTTGKYEIWRSDGTSSGTFLIHSGLGIPYYIVTLGNIVFFVGKDNFGSELWKSDGTLGGTQIVKDISNGIFDSNPYNLFVYDKNTLLFAANDGSGLLSSLWKTNGTASGTVKISSVAPAKSYTLKELQELYCFVGKTLFFDGYTESEGYELWKLSSLASSPVLVKNLNPNSSSVPKKLTNAKGTLFFTADDGVNGVELWSSKGTISNTVISKNITLGNQSTYFTFMCGANNKCFFTYNNNLWVSDGTENGTKIVLDEGITNVSRIAHLIANGNKIFFTGYTFNFGEEMYEGDASLVSLMPSPMKSSDQEAIVDNTISATVFPNPVNSSATIQLKGNLKAISITATDVNGKVFFSKNYIDAPSVIRLPVQNLLSGLYLVRVSNGKTINTIKFIKQ